MLKLYTIRKSIISQKSFICSAKIFNMLTKDRLFSKFKLKYQLLKRQNLSKSFCVGYIAGLPHTQGNSENFKITENLRETQVVFK